MQQKQQLYLQFHMSAASGNLDEFLAENGVSDLNQLWDGEAAIHHSAKHNNAANIVCLSEKGAGLEVVNSSGFTALHVAAYYGNEIAILALLAEGANLNALVAKVKVPNVGECHTALYIGKKASEIARLRGHEDLASELFYKESEQIANRVCRSESIRTPQSRKRILTVETADDLSASPSDNAMWREAVEIGKKFEAGMNR